MNDDLQAVYATTVADVEQMRLDYQGNQVEDRHQDKLRAILSAPSLEAAQVAAKRARDSVLTWYLSEWSKGKIPGRVTVHSLERDANAAEGLAKMLDTKGDPEAADRQRQRARELRLSARAMTAAQ